MVLRVDNMRLTDSLMCDTNWDELMEKSNLEQNLWSGLCPIRLMLHRETGMFLYKSKGRRVWKHDITACSEARLVPLHINLKKDYTNHCYMHILHFRNVNAEISTAWTSTAKKAAAYTAYQSKCVFTRKYALKTRCSHVCIFRTMMGIWQVGKDNVKS